MSRWEPNARERLTQAAMELYRKRGFDETTVAEIAARAGLTERTFFRYFADKREVLFWGSGALQTLITDNVAGAPEGATPMDAVAAALEATSAIFEPRRAFARQRHALITSHPELQERELIKLASLAAAIAEALHRRGVTDPAALLASEAGIAIFKLAFERWVHDTKGGELSRHVREALRALKAVTAGGDASGARASKSRATTVSRPKRARGAGPE